MSRTSPSAAYPSFPEDAAAVTPSDSDTFAPSTLYVGGEGDVKVITASGTTVTFSSVFAGSNLPVRVKAVLATGTTATNIVRVF